MHHRSWDHSSSCAPVFLRREKMGECTLQDLANLWHDQDLFHYGFDASLTTVCLQVNRFPALGDRSKFPRSLEQNSFLDFACFLHSTGWIVRWINFCINFLWVNINDVFSNIFSFLMY